MKTIYYLLGCMAFFFMSCNEQSPQEQKHPRPDGFFFDYEAFEKDSIQKEYKRRYKRELYYAEEGTNVDSIRLEHMYQHMHRSRMKVAASGTFANGTIRGEWFQRGPVNEAGDLREVDYDPQNDSLYVLSTVGHIWKGHLSGENWRLLNDKIRFNTNLLKHIKREDGGDRLIAAYGSGKENKAPRYSDDMGETWSLPSGIGDGFYDGWGGPKKMIELSDGKTLFYMVHTWKGSPWGNAMEIYKSTDRGLSYSLVLSMNGGGYDFEEVDMWKPENADVIYVIDNNKKQFYTINHSISSGATSLSSPATISGINNGNVKLTGRYSNGNPTFYVLSGRNRVYKSTSANGSAWTDLGQTTIDGATESIFRNVWMANPVNNQLYMGGFQLYKTSDERNWTQQYSYWWTYYDKNIPLPGRKDNMHVDMMDMKFFRKADNTPFFIILNHAGIYASYDNLQSTVNLCQQNLNVVTLYDHATAPDGTIFYGAQDKGTFRNISDNNAGTAQVESENMTTGDGMRELFFNNGQSWFGFIQNGSMLCMPDKKGTRQHWWQVPGDHIPGWINPVENHPDPAAKKCYVAGGNLNGGAGSYLIEMEVSFTGTGSGFQWQPRQFDYDFRANSRNGRSVIKALSASTADHNRLYVATQDASFFYSTNRGTSWTRSTYTLPSSLLPWDIAVSPTDADKLFICGTGWSNDGVYMSEDGGASFTSLGNNAIQATYFDIVLSPDESVLYAATSEGPFAYVFAENSWFSISADNSPFVEYRSVEYISAKKTVRFGTYGRGVWDFVLSEDDLVADCNNELGGSAYTDNCGNCVGGSTGKSPCQTPYAQHFIPGTIQAEEYDLGGEMISYHDLTASNDGGAFRPDEGVDITTVNGGGYLLGWTGAGEWTEYTVEVQEGGGKFDIHYTVASPNEGAAFHLELDDVNITGSITITGTGGWQQWETQTLSEIQLDGGTHILKFVSETAGYDIDKIQFTPSVVTGVADKDATDATLFPNPASGGSVAVKAPGASKYQVLNTAGQVVKTGHISGVTQINIHGLQAGTYLVKLYYGERKVLKKLIVE